MLREKTSRFIMDTKREHLSLSKISIHSCTIKNCLTEENLFCRYCLQVSRTAQILKCHINNCFGFTSKQMVIMPKK